MSHGINVSEERQGDHVFWRVTFNETQSGLYPTREAACRAARAMLDLEEVIAKVKLESLT